jgi:cytochrome c peroxidase
MSSHPAPSSRSTLWQSMAAVGLLSIVGGATLSQGIPADPANLAWQAGFVSHMQEMRRFVDPDSSDQLTPAVIRELEQAVDVSGRISTLQPNGPTTTSQNAFFANLGTNGRTCFSCHQPQDGWSVSAASVQARFTASNGTDPIFRLVDGANCPSADVSSVKAKRGSYSLLLNKGLIRVGLPMPATTQFRVLGVQDPYNCNTNPVTGLTSPTTGIVSIYRRPLPSTNLGFLSAIMWDGREPSLLSQAGNATLGHAQAAVAPTALQRQQIVNFEMGVLTAQSFDNKAGLLNSQGAAGGPDALQQVLAGFFIGINDPLGFNPFNIPFTSQVFDAYRAWRTISGPGTVVAARQSVARGEQLFNNTTMNITGVGGLNDAFNAPSIPGFCGTCHDTPNVGNHSVVAPLNIGIADAGTKSPPALNIADLPVFTLQCFDGPLTGQIFVVTDPGRALISGNCADIGKVKGPILRGLAARAPYFHNGSAATLMDVMNFYDARFNLGLTEQDKRDFVAFLQTL